MNLPINRNRYIVTLANDIIDNGVNIDVEDIERIIDIYERYLQLEHQQD